MKTNKISVRKFTLRLMSLLDEIPDVSKKLTENVAQGILQTIIKYSEDLDRSENWIVKGFSEAYDDLMFDGLSFNSLTLVKIGQTSSGIAYIKAKDSLDQRFFLFLDESEVLRGYFSKDDNEDTEEISFNSTLEIIGGPSKVEGAYIPGDKDLDPDEIKLPQQPLDIFMKNAAIFLSKKGIKAANYREIAEGLISEKQIANIVFDSELLGIEEAEGIPFIHYRQRLVKNVPWEEVFLVWDGRSYTTINLSYGNWGNEDYKEKSDLTFEEGEDEIPEPKGVKDYFISLLPKAVIKTVSSQTSSSSLSGKTVKDLSIDDLRSYKELLTKAFITESSSLLAAITSELDDRYKQVAAIDMTQYKDTYWKISIETAEYFINIIEFDDPFEKPLTRIISKTKNQITIIDDKINIRLETDGTLKLSSGEELKKIEKEEYDKLHKLFE